MLDMFDAACIPPQELLTRVLTVPWNDFSLAIQREMQFSLPLVHGLESYGAEDGGEANVQILDRQKDALDVQPARGEDSSHESQVVHPGIPPVWREQVPYNAFMDTGPLSRAITSGFRSTEHLRCNHALQVEPKKRAAPLCFVSPCYTSPASAAFLKGTILGSGSVSERKEKEMPKQVKARAAQDEREERAVPKLARSQHAPADWMWHARMVVESWVGKTPDQIAQEMHCHPQTVRLHVARFNQQGIEGVGVQPGSGRKPRLTEVEPVSSSLCPVSPLLVAW